MAVGDCGYGGDGEDACCVVVAAAAVVVVVVAVAGGGSHVEASDLVRILQRYSSVASP